MTSMEKIERISEILAFIIRLMGGRAYSKTKLVKLIYLLDVIHARRGIPRFSGIEYKSYYYGPYSDDIDKSLQFLEERGYITISHKMGAEGNMYYCFVLHDTPEFGRLDGKERSRIQQLLTPLIERPIHELLDITYTTKEYQQTDFNKVIRL